MKKAIALIGIIACVVTCLALRQPAPAGTAGVSICLDHLRQASARFAQNTALLKKAIAAIGVDTAGVGQAKAQLADCRRSYKSIEFFVEYFFEQRIRIFNQPPVYEVEEPYIEFQHPIGLQAVEAGLFGDSVSLQKKDLLAQAEVMQLTAENMMSYLYGKTITDASILQAVQQELIRIYTLGITGYDAPELKTGISESAEALQALGLVLQPYLALSSGSTGDSVRLYLHRSIQLLQRSPSFDAFNRLRFYTEAALPLQEAVNRLVQQRNEPAPTTTLYNDAVPHLFSPGSIRPVDNGMDVVATPALLHLGQQLFSETALSGNGLRSCATCHRPNQYFTDGQTTSIAFNGRDKVLRNAPSLLYAAYQHHQFLDGRAADLSAQLLEVLQSPLEMNSRPEAVVRLLQKDAGYASLFAAAFPAASQDSLITIDHIAQAISSYEQSFPITHSAFDRYMQGQRKALTIQQQQGFNLFMGKAACGTCHFAPLFNGLLPPTYAITEVESLGLTRDTRFKRPVADTDSGRYRFFPIEFYIGAFKTPSLRNVAHTAPYMHNGAFTTLKQVLDFYNKGGGKGLGLDMPHQTLSDKPLQLSKKEMRSIVRFLEALTDEQYTRGYRY